MGIGYQELLLIFLIVMLVFGGKKIPELARGLGRGISEFKKARDGIVDEIEKSAPEATAGESKPGGTATTAAAKPAGDATPPATS